MKSILTTPRIFSLASCLVAVLSRVQTHAQATVAEGGAASTPAQAVLASSASILPGSSWVLARERHFWARFEPGSWPESEITTETFDESGKVYGRSVTTQKEIVNSVADESYVLNVQATVEVAGERIAGPRTGESGSHHSAQSCPPTAVTKCRLQAGPRSGKFSPRSGSGGFDLVPENAALYYDSSFFSARPAQRFHADLAPRFFTREGFI